MNHSKYMLYTGLISIIGLISISMGEFLMLYSPTGGYGIANNHINFLYHSIETQTLGFYLGVIAAPIYLLVYDHIAKMLKVGAKLHWIILAITTIGFVIGNLWLGSNLYLAHLVHGIAAGEPLQQSLIFIDSVSEPLLQIVRVAVLSLSGIVIWKILQGKTLYPKWGAFMSPFILIIAIFLLFAGGTTLGTILLPAALNFSHLFFIIFSTYYAYKNIKKNSSISI